MELAPPERVKSLKGLIVCGLLDSEDDSRCIYLTRDLLRLHTIGRSDAIKIK